ncbi:MAG: PIN domain-containing protein [Bacteroidetes bacterium]|nr:PIN domain-containing protein [Bacteroidota bacterium]
MKIKYLVDTVIIIDHLNGIKKATDWLLKNADGSTVISVITRAEVLSGAEENEKSSISTLLDKFECLAITKEISDIAAELSQKKGWKLPDAFQAALAKKNNLLLVTRNTKDFSPKLDFVNIPYKI